MVEIVGKLGLVFTPPNSMDRQAHAAKVALLAEDCADLPIEHLRDAAAEWRRTKPFLPKACELREETLARARLAMRGRMIAPIRDEQPTPESPPLSDAEIATMPSHILAIGIACGDISQERADRVRSRETTDTQI